MKPAILLTGILLAGVCLPVSPCAAQLIAASSGTRPAPPPPAVPRTYTVTLSPAAVPDEALKYSFVPDVFDQTEGNAATFYMRAVILFNQMHGSSDKDLDFFDEFLSALKPDPRVRDALVRCESIIDQIELGALRESCRWESTIRERGFDLLPELSSIRAIVRVLATRARLQVADKDYDKAIHTLRTGFTLSRHLTQQGALVNGIVAASCSAQLMDVLRELTQQPDAPNLYWAIASLPRPLIDHRQIIMWEMNEFYFSFPQLRNAPTDSVGAVQWQKMWDDLRSMLRMESDPETVKLLFAAAATRTYSVAKSYLISTGIPADEVEKMSVLQAMGIYWVRSYHQISESHWKWWLLPFPQAKDGMQRAEAELMRLKSQDPFNPLNYLMPALSAAYARFVWIDRDTAAGQCVEGLRAYAATHSGQLPQGLDLLIDTPAPLDPTTGKAFIYKATGKTAVLDSPSTDDDVRHGLRYEITIR